MIFFFFLPSLSRIVVRGTREFPEPSSGGGFKAGEVLLRTSGKSS
jgi:hypothetical protein